MSEAAKMPSNKAPNLTLIVAATKNLGIGRNGTLPWRLRAEMQYFARVTTRLPPQFTLRGPGKVQNAVVMGRKTWDSIPKKFRPLKDRLNIVLSSRAEVAGEHKFIDGALWLKSWEDVLNLLQTLRADANNKSMLDLPPVARVFVIGGANVYRSALELPGGIANRVLLTRIHSDFECDTFFPLALDSEAAEKLGWHRKSNSELTTYIGEQVDEGTIEEGETEFEYCLYERSQASD
ncbi:uncharacterized protein PV09_06618 [Verruconis gallopava]|uniref:Dihydrofolate reductase n=1 Tax=Verruconis gallopava TaxID=253628 RepID=A0A0D2A6D5_9PEZI|nr:uncharacterized protein PV09_06618 [Verruconis gallopava]KIW02130.1 hypothetical protein PV09_06618 [Verruconis gallopava]